MIKSIIDTGPIVALFDRSDHYHLDVLNFMQGFSGKLFSTLPVFTEVEFLLDFNIKSQLDFLKWLESGAVEIVNISGQDLFRIREMMDKYKDVPMDFADATLMLISEMLNLGDIISFDKDFFVYRKSNGSCLNNLLSDLMQVRK